MEIDKEVKEIVSKQLDINIDKMKNDASFIDDLGADSLDVVELIMALEEKFDIRIPDEDAEKMNTIGNVIEYIKTKVDVTSSECCCSSDGGCSKN